MKVSVSFIKKAEKITAKKMKYFVVFALLVCGALCIEFDRPCRDDVDAKENFSVAFVRFFFFDNLFYRKTLIININLQYTGTWYEIQNSFTILDQCVEHHYTRRLLLNAFEVERVHVIDGDFFFTNREVFLAFPDETPLRAIFNATIANDDGDDYNYNYRVVATG